MRSATVPLATGVLGDTDEACATAAVAVAVVGEGTGAEEGAAFAGVAATGVAGEAGVVPLSRAILSATERCSSAGDATGFSTAGDAAAADGAATGVPKDLGAATELLTGLSAAAAFPALSAAMRSFTVDMTVDPLTSRGSVQCF